METSEKIDLLVALQEKDTELNNLKQQITKDPEDINSQKELSEKYRSDAENEKKTLLDLQKAKKEKELDLETKETEIKKHNLELGSIKSNDAYKALLIEIESGKQDQSALENDILELMEKIDEESKKAKDVDSESKKREIEIQGKIKELENEIKVLQEKYNSLKAERDEFAKKIPEDLLSHYDHIREGRDELAIVSLDGESCGGCGSILRPQTINDLHKGKELVVCDNCSRFVYLKK
ncbi:zinc ribbon domain-containing protein [Elusimicrobiota bacterium]